MAGWLKLLKRTWTEFGEDQCPRLAAALSYATIFSIPPLLVLLLLLLGTVLDPTQVRQALEGQLSGIVGADAARQIHQILQSAQRPGIGRGSAALIGFGTLFVGAIGAFTELQADLNTIWEVKPDPKKGGLRTFIVKRVLSFGLVLTIGFLLLVSFILTTALAALGDVVAAYLPAWMSGALLQAAGFAVSFAVITLLFALMYKYLPDAEVAWRDVWVGALATAFLFTVGKYLIGLYLAHSNPGRSFGAAASVILILVWVYYSANILFFGAEFTEVWASERGAGIRPKRGAVRIVIEERPMQPPGSASAAD
ncbi:MAG TPA: YihY/virulence factor BrkB family protein [Longimicrobiales bacterium]|nr:YihY/virulence factor BrkB family protein [Longimicrobiales bacterium]